MISVLKRATLPALLQAVPCGSLPVHIETDLNMQKQLLRHQIAGGLQATVLSKQQRIVHRVACPTTAIPAFKQGFNAETLYKHTIQQQQARRQQFLCRTAAGSGSSSSSSSSSSGSSQPNGNWMGWFDRLPPRVQLGIMGGLLFFGMIVIPFLQPTFLYGDSNKSLPSQPHTITEVRTADGTPAVMQKYQLPRYIPVASELYDFLQENAMPRTLPDGRSESPGVLRIYISSLTILALFYACSAVLSLILRGVAAFLRAAGIMGPAPPPGPEQ